MGSWARIFIATVILAIGIIAFVNRQQRQSRDRVARTISTQRTLDELSLLLVSQQSHILQLDAPACDLWRVLKLQELQELHGVPENIRNRDGCVPDAWGEPIQLSRSRSSKNVFVLSSSGPNRLKEEGGDDILVEVYIGEGR